jgi:biotin synthase
MCYAIPGRVEAMDDRYVTVDYFGEKKRAINELPGLRIGDFIYAQGGFVIQALPEQEARSILSVWKETFFELQEMDLRLSRLDMEDRGVNKKTLRILDKAAESRALSDDELYHLLTLENEHERAMLYKTANFLRRKHLGNSCCVHGIIEFSSYCARNCFYCGISTHNNKLTRYRMTDGEIYAAVDEAVETHGFQALVLQSGEDPEFPAPRLAELIREIKRRHPCLIFVSVGEVGIGGLQELYDAGARGVLLRFETSNPELYQNLHPGFTLDSRIAHLKAAYEMGYLIITGGLIGVPGQTKHDMLNDILLARELHSEMYSFGPFIPHPGTPLADQPVAPVEQILNTLAVARAADPDNAKILVTTSFETADPQAREKGLMAGANSVMLNVTPEHFRECYEIYPNRAHLHESIPVQIETTLNLLRGLGRAPTDLGV